MQCSKMDSLSDIWGCCRGLETDKISERKNNVEKLQRLLSKSHIIKNLDKNTDDKLAGHGGDRLITWNNIFKAVVAYVRIETDILQKSISKKTLSNTTLQNKEKKKQEISGFFKFFIGVADKRGPRLKCSSVISHILESLNDEYTCSAYGLDYSTILLKNILPVRKYCVTLSSETWHELLIQYCRMYLDPDCSLDHVVLARLIRLIVHGSTKQCDLQPKKILLFFTETFKNIRKEKISQVNEHLLSALNIYCTKIAPSSRIQLIKLGETIFIKLLYLWSNRPTDVMKDEIVEFLRLQMQVHHPCGAKSIENGAAALDWDVWKSSLRKLYEVMYDDLQQMGGRNRFTSNAKDCALSFPYIDLAADVCNQLFSELTYVIDVTQLTMLGDGDANTPKKKRRLESGWSSVIDILASHCNNLQIVPWLQLVSRLVEKYPANVPEDQLIPLLQCLAKRLTECKRSEILRHLFGCLEKVVHGYSSFTHMPVTTLTFTKLLWLDIWSACLRTMSSHHAEVEGFQQPGFALLTAIMEEKLITPEREIWNLFLPSVSLPTDASTRFLAAFLTLHDLPENYRPNILGSCPTVDQGLYPLRKHLFDWFIPMRDVSEVGLKSRNRNKIDPWLVSKVLTSLTMRSPSSVLETYTHTTERFSYIEKLYLQTSFDNKLDFEQVLSSPSDTLCADVSQIPVLLQVLMSLFNRERKHFEEIVEPQFQHLEDLAFTCCLVTSCLQQFLSYKVISVDMIPVVGLDTCLQSLLRKLTTLLADYIKKEGVAHLLSFIVLLDKMLLWNDSKEHSSFIVSELIRTLMPSKLIDLLFDVAFDNFVKTSGSTSKTDMSRFTQRSNIDRKSTPVRSRSRVLDDFDDMDMDFEDASQNGKEEDLDISFDDGDVRESQDSDESGSQSDVCASLLSRHILSDHQRLCLQFVTALCHSSGFERSKSSLEIPYKASLESTMIKSRLQEFLDDKHFDSSRPLDLQILEIIVNELTTPDHKVTETDLENMIYALRQVARSQWHDQEVSCLCLELLSRLVPHLTDQNRGPSTMTKNALHLVSSYIKLQDDGSCSSQVRLALTKCMRAFVECDPEGEWSMLKGSSDTNTPSTILSEFPNCLLDNCQAARMYAAQAFYSLFVISVDENSVPKGKELQLLAFDRIYEVCNDLLKIKGKLSEERMQDERNNRTASALLALGTVACSSPVCEKNSLFAFCQLITEMNLDVIPIQKILHKIALTLGYKDVSSYIFSHLPFLVHQWLDLDYPIEEFPFQLMSMTSETMFYRTYTSILIPELLMHQQLESIQKIAESLQEELHTLLKRCVPVIVVHILPLFAASKTDETVSDASVRKRIGLASKCHDLLVQQISQQAFDTSILHHIDEIIVNILMCLYDEREGNGENGYDPDPNPPCYNSYIIKSTLDYLTRSFSGNSKSLVSVLAKTQDSIQKVLLELSIFVSHEHRVHKKRRILLMYELFVGMLLKEFQGQLGGSWAFVFRDVVYRVVHILRDVNKSQRSWKQIEQRYVVEITDMCLGLLYKVCHVGVELCPQELVKYLPWIVSNTMEYVTENGGEKAETLLDYLMLENSRLLKDGIIKLDPFPDKVCFHKYTKVYNSIKTSLQCSLRNEIYHFVEVYGEHKTLTEGSIEGIRHLRSLLASQSTDLSTLVQQCQENEDNSLLCQLVCELIQLAQCPVQTVSEEAACCLGIIGPVDLGEISLLKPALNKELKEAMEVFSDDPIKQKYCSIFHQLNDYLLDPCIDVVKSAGEVLKKMFATKMGSEFYAMYKTHLSERHLLIHYLHPFRPGKKKVQVSGNGLKSLEVSHKEVDCDVWVVNHDDYDVWLKDITYDLLQSGAITDEILSVLKPICKIKSKFCEDVLPFLIHDILLSGDRAQHAVLSSRIASFFHKHCELVKDGRCSTTKFISGEKSICLNKDAVQTMLNIVQYLRQQDRPKQTPVLTPWNNNFWLDIDYLEVAKAAQFCSAYFSTILYSEIWSDTKRGDEQPGSSSQSQTERVTQEFSQNTRMDVLGSSPSTSTSVCIQDLMLDAYRCIGDPDGIYGCGAGRLADSSSRVKTYLHENKWEKAVITFDIEMKNTPISYELGLLQTVQNFGAEGMLGLCLQGISCSSQQIVSPEIQELQYEAAWRAGQWNLDSPSRLDSGMGFHQGVYCALDAMKDGQMSLSKIAVDTARCSILKSGDVNLESCRSIYPLLSKLHCLAQLDDVLTVKQRKDGDLLNIVEKWNNQKLVSNDFEFIQPILNVRCSLVKVLLKKDQNKGLQASLSDHLHTLAQLARDSGRYQVAERCIYDLKDCLGGDKDNKLRIDLEEAELYWARAEHNIAKHLMKTLISNLEKLQGESFEAVRLLPAALGTYGNWLGETRSENPSVIMDNYLQRAVDLLEQTSADDDLALEAYMSLGQFVDTQYQNIVNYMKSSTYEAKQALMKEAKVDADRYRSVANDRDRYLRTLEKQSEIDEQEVVTMEEDRNTFLEKAVGYYIKCLRLGDKHDLRIFRLTSLWFENAASDIVNELLDKSIPLIKSYKFLPLLYQLAARMSVKQNNCALFQPTLEKILETAAVDHPHHSVPVILGLAHANKDAELLARGKSSKRGSRLSKSSSETEGSEDRVQAAKNMIEKLKKNKKVSGIVTNMETLSTAYIHLANWNVEQYKKETRPINLPGTMMLTQLKNLNNLAVPTIETKVDPSGKYDNIVFIQRFLGTFKLAGGVNLPKILTVVGSDGIERRQLVKGRDDLRQDAVMQQVFGMLNNLLKKNPQTRKRHLRVRTYKVIPLSQRSGLLEWCEGTQPIGEYLIGSSSVKGAHKRYYPHDWTALECRNHIAKLHTIRDVKEKMRAYLEACKHFHPVFRQFFMEKFSDPATWFERRLAYTRSVATNSIVGYILGLGDRHIMNILIDCNTAELIHIDLGIAFEQGKILPTPETVPFRLTRDIVDGMGVTGVEGVFRRSCEKTMEVMHGNQEVLLMILQVLLYDPLYVWTLSPQKMYALQHKRDPDQSDLNTTSVTDIVQTSQGSGERQDQVNKVAERVLLRLHQKLQGVEDGIQLSIMGQVNHVIQEARDPKNLCRLFPGWQPYI